MNFPSDLIHLINFNESKQLIKDFEQKNWERDSSISKIALKDLAFFLQTYNFEEYYEEILNNIFGPKFDEARKSKKGICGWSIEEVSNWIKYLNFLSPVASKLASNFEEQWIDGDMFMNLDENISVELGLEMKHYLLLNCIMQGWTHGWIDFIECPPGLPPSVVVGIRADLTSSTLEEARQICYADDEASHSGIGSIYGQLVVLGYKEYRFDGSWQPVGIQNEKFLLKRRKIPNGLKEARVLTLDPDRPHTLGSHTGYNITINFTSSLPSPITSFNSFSYSSFSSLPTSVSSHTGSPIRSSNLTGPGSDKKIIIEFERDNTKDYFQIGRQEDQRFNDLVVHGQLHTDPQGLLSSPVSRYACRIECERLPPYRSFLYAAGFNDKKEIFLSERAPKWAMDKELIDDPREGRSREAGEGQRVRGQSGIGRSERVTAGRDEVNGVGSSEHKENQEERNLRTTLPLPLSSSSPSDGHIYYDAFTTFGIKLWNPHLKEWGEVSVRGHMYPLRGSQQYNPSPSLSPSPSPSQTPHPSTMDTHQNNQQQQTINRNQNNTFSSIPSFTNSLASFFPSLNTHFLSNTPPTPAPAPAPSPAPPLHPFPLSIPSQLFPYTPTHPMPLPSPFTNELFDGSIIDVGGVCLLFRKSDYLFKRAHLHPIEYISKLNALKPQCPVLLNTLEFSFTDSRERAIRAIRRLESQGRSYMPLGASLSVPNTDYSHVEEESRSYVYPNCGHISGYHKSLEGKPCPLCRMAGPFVPLAFSFEPSICHRPPTHVFSPCGHVASKEVCELWANTPLLSSRPPICGRAAQRGGASSSSNSSPPSSSHLNSLLNVSPPQLTHACPYCSISFTSSSPVTQRGNGKGCIGGRASYSKLILQTESGEAWESAAIGINWLEMEKETEIKSEKDESFPLSNRSRNDKVAKKVREYEKKVIGQDSKRRTRKFRLKKESRLTEHIEGYSEIGERDNIEPSDNEEEMIMSVEGGCQDMCEELFEEDKTKEGQGNIDYPKYTPQLVSKQKN